MNTILDILFNRAEHLFARAGGPLNFRLVVMPTVVTILAILAGRRDAREGRPAPLGAFFTVPVERQRLLRMALKDIGRVFVVAIVLDTIYQLWVFRWVYPGSCWSWLWRAQSCPTCWSGDRSSARFDGCWLREQDRRSGFLFL